MNYAETFNSLDWETEQASIDAKTELDVQAALASASRGLEDFKALLSPAAAPYLEQMAAISRELTLKRFGKTIQLYLPLYLSNYCTNHCRYCGFSKQNHLERVVLNDQEILKEVAAIKAFGYEHILLVTGDDPKIAGIDYLLHVIRLIKPYFSLISIEVQPLKQEEYESLIREGLNTVYLYQETYHQSTYGENHPAGQKKDFNYRLDTPDRLGRAGIHRMGLGVLLGLEDWRTDALMTAHHLKYLEKTYWRTKYSISFPRLRPYAGEQHAYKLLTDRELVQLICAYRLLDGEVELSMSVRESETFRDNILKLGITSMSAGSRTNPGGYANHTESLEQFEVHDNRTPAEIEAMIRQQGYEAVWKDWDGCMQA